MVAENEVWVSQIRKGVVEIAVLALLARREMYGSEMVAELAGQRSLAISAGTVYPLLSRLKKTGVIDSSWRESPVGPPRKYYSLTPAGVSVLAAMTESWNSLSVEITQLLKEGRG